jgi:hypothetical protein
MDSPSVTIGPLDLSQAFVPYFVTQNPLLFPGFRPLTLGFQKLSSRCEFFLLCFVVGEYFVLHSSGSGIHGSSIGCDHVLVSIVRGIQASEDHVAHGCEHVVVSIVRGIQS